MALPPELPRNGQDAEQPKSDARRRLLQGGLAAGSVVMTVASRPVLGQVACLTPSASTSMPTSGNAPTQACSGLQPGQWQAMGTQWPSPYVGVVPGANTNDPAASGSDPGCGTTTAVVTAPPPTTTSSFSLRTSRGVYGSSRLGSAPSTPSTSTSGTQCGSTTTSTTTSGTPTTTTSGGTLSPLMQIRQQLLGVAPAPVAPTTSAASPTVAAVSSPTTSTSTTSGSTFFGMTSTGTRRGGTMPGSTTSTPTTPTTSPVTNPAPQGSNGTPFHSTTTGFGGSTFGTQTMMDVIASGGSQMSGIGPYMAAALLNARSGRTPVLTEATVRNMWNDLINRGYFEPTAGVRWGATQIISYIRTTMG